MDFETVPLTSDSEWEDMPDVSSTEPMPSSPHPDEAPLPKNSVTIKRESLDTESHSDNNSDLNDSNNPEYVDSEESVCTMDLHLDETLSTSHPPNTSISSDNPKKSPPKSLKKKRRNFTHWRGARRYLKRCDICNQYLHSKTTYARHMVRYHSGKQQQKKFGAPTDHDFDIDIETIEDIEDELESLEKDAPLTPVQQNIISQLKTFSCYACDKSFIDRRTTLNHIRQHMPDLRSYTCIACLTEFADRSIYKIHCGASFQCAMKIALVIPERGTEKYFTCNMCLRSLTNRKELLTHLSKHSEKQYQQLIASPPQLKPKPSQVSTPKRSSPCVTFVNLQGRTIPAPFQNGEGSQNNLCIQCGMIYRRRLNLERHQELCDKIAPEERISYRCARCGMTFLEYRKLQSHMSIIHRTKIIPCYRCDTEFTKTVEFLSHYRKECPGLVSEKKIGSYSCALCPRASFSTRTLFAEHRRKLHLDLKIYSCAICRKTFETAGALETHVRGHELGVASDVYDQNSSMPSDYGAGKRNRSLNSDPGTSRNQCHTCGKIFANYPNLRRHVRTVHDAVGRYSCFTCSKTFVSKELWKSHVESEHQETAINCPHCPENFGTSTALIEHCRNVHGINGEDQLGCYICGKKFQNVASLRIHRGHHFRVNSRLSINNTSQNSIELDDEPIVTPPVRSPRAKKSFPNGGTMVRQLQNMLQCQVCDDRFKDVSTLRRHLWDVHCAKNKPEKRFDVERLQCELCTNVLPDEESLASHMKWHRDNPILGEVSKRKKGEPLCDICGKMYSSVMGMLRHRKCHERPNYVAKRGRYAGKGFGCDVCGRICASRATLDNHMQHSHRLISRKRKAERREENQNNQKKPRLEFNHVIDNPGFGSESSSSRGEKPVTCSLCRKVLPNMRLLYRHRKEIHKIFTGIWVKVEPQPQGNSRNSGAATCPTCKKTFKSLVNMRIHCTKSHGIGGEIGGFKCNLCPRELGNKKSLEKHMLLVHKSFGGGEKNPPFRNSNLGGPVVDGTNRRQCPICKIVYPNIKAMNIHYFKKHQKAN